MPFPPESMAETVKMNGKERNSSLIVHKMTVSWIKVSQIMGNLRGSFVSVFPSWLMSLSGPRPGNRKNIPKSPLFPDVLQIYLRDGQKLIFA